MPLPPGLRLGHYEILLSLGSGGLGEDHRGRDSRLERDAALKVLTLAFVQDERMLRFERETKVLAALNHIRNAEAVATQSSPAGHCCAFSLRTK
jgi:serine/threonine protein kinase